MAEQPTRDLRIVGASLVTLSGILLVASLWFHPLSEPVVVNALLGAVYLILGIGLFGWSRFSLFLGVLLPSLMLAWLYTNGQDEPLSTLRMALDGSAAFCCAVTLWRVRKEPSV